MLLQFRHLRQQRAHALLHLDVGEDQRQLGQVALECLVGLLDQRLDDVAAFLAGAVEFPADVDIVLLEVIGDLVAVGLLQD
ncbi:MAG: hypothetical protein E5V99_24350, partial [Mesorhizobium sp.]